MMFLLMWSRPGTYKSHRAKFCKRSKLSKVSIPMKSLKNDETSDDEVVRTSVFGWRTCLIDTGSMADM